MSIISIYKFVRKPLAISRHQGLLSVTKKRWLSTGNTLLETPHLECRLPPFEQIHIEQFEPAIVHLVKEFNANLNRFENDIKGECNPNWESVANPLTKIGGKLSHVWGLLGHLMSVQNTEKTRMTYQKLQPMVIEAFNQQNQSEIIYNAYQELKVNEKKLKLLPAQNRIIDSYLLQGQLSGIALSGERKVRFNGIKLRLAELSTKFSNNVLDSTKKFQKLVTCKDDLNGFPMYAKELAAKNATQNGHPDANAIEGPWLLSLDAPCLSPILTHCSNRKLREEFYKENCSRASELSKYSNVPIVTEILQLRQEKAQMLGYKSYAELSIASKMAPSVEAVDDLMQDLRNKCKNKAKAELDALRNFAKSKGCADELLQWDIPFWTEQYRMELFNVSDNILKPYFQLPRVLSGLFKLSEQLFGIRIREANRTSYESWHPDVKLYTIYNEWDKEIASFYLDPYSRPHEKNGGAWMNTCLGKSSVMIQPNTDNRNPVAYLICNQSPPTVATNVSLMTFREVETLFHEFGHGLQHMLTTVDYDDAAGINGVEWDAVEIPSQFMENFCYHEPTIKAISSHVETGETLPQHLYNQVCEARKFMSGTSLLRQIYFTMMDLQLHQLDMTKTTLDIPKFQRKMADKFSLLQPIPEDRMLCAFSHIFAGGYAAGYYSYKWAEVLSCDAFEAFVESGLDDPETLHNCGRRFRDTFLALGGSVHPQEVFKTFRGREYSPKALLEMHGLTK